MPVIGNVIQATISGTYLELPWVSTHYYRCTTASADPGAMSWLAEQVHTYVANYSQFAIDSWVLNEVNTTNLSNTAEVGSKSQSILGAIPNTEGRTPSGVNIFFKLIRSSTVTRNGIRYMNGLPERDIAGNSYTGNTTALNAYLTWYLASPSSGTFGGYSPVIVRKRSGGLPPIDNAIRAVVFRGVTVMNRRMK